MKYQVVYLNVVTVCLNELDSVCLNGRAGQGKPSRRYCSPQYLFVYLKVRIFKCSYRRKIGRSKKGLSWLVEVPDSSRLKKVAFIIYSHVAGETSFSVPRLWTSKSSICPSGSNPLGEFFGGVVCNSWSGSPQMFEGTPPA